MTTHNIYSCTVPCGLKFLVSAQDDSVAKWVTVVYNFRHSIWRPNSTTSLQSVLLEGREFHVCRLSQKFLCLFDYGCLCFFPTTGFFLGPTSSRCIEVWDVSSRFLLKWLLMVGVLEYLFVFWALFLRLCRYCRLWGGLIVTGFVRPFRDVDRYHHGGPPFFRPLLRVFLVISTLY